MTSFNLLLAKGENRLGYIFDIIVRNRCRLNAWSSDISKLYNQLHLDISALPYSLFLFHNSLDPKAEPEVWIMTRAWYVISSTGGQAGARNNQTDRYGRARRSGCCGSSGEG